MDFNYSKLRGRIREMFKTEGKFEEAMGFSSTSLSAKLNNNVEFTQKEMDRASTILKIERKDIPEYFFTTEVQEAEQE